ncbi:hypothetical protein EYF80_047482 [Liparis tanakae]|uniref:Uncharacterized protein n=1 Tax=Liparis tanakae TaxID=230148 RepID=A0A4Z2FMU4_9TELE|nr:hypothetical protein EYF80_047482 [Liparis tanakae]
MKGSQEGTRCCKLNEVEQHIEKGGVLAVGLHHVTRTRHLLAQSPQRHLVTRSRFCRRTCRLAREEESCSMSMMMGKSSSIHFLISRPLT